MSDSTECNLHISCKKPECRFEIDWTQCPSIEHAKMYYFDWNKRYAREMECLHDYSFEVVS